MKYRIKKIYLILLLISIFFTSITTVANSSNKQYSQDTISNYLSGILSTNQNATNKAYKYFNRVQPLKDIHKNFNIQFIKTLILLEKFEEAFAFSKSIWVKEESIFEVDLLLGINSFINKDYLNAEMYFARLNKTPQVNFFYEDFLSNILITWVKASQNNKKDTFSFFDKIPNRYENLKKIQNSFLQCYFDAPETFISFKELISDEEYSFVRYSFFLANYLLAKNNELEAKKIIEDSSKAHSSNLLIKQSKNFILNKNIKKIRNSFNCQKSKDSISEIFYIMANLYSTQRDYKTSNFYLKISLFLNKKFTSNKTLLAENYFYQKKYESSKKVYKTIKTIGPIYSWHASKKLASISIDQKGKKNSIDILEKEFSNLKNPNYNHYYEMANFYKDNENYKKSIKYYSLALQDLKKDHPLFPKILDRRGTSYERNGEWEKGEQDLMQSLKILPDQPYVLNYLAYTWIEKKININKAIQMLIKATELRGNDGYIIDSLGWGYYASKNYIDAEKFLQKAVELKPQDPTINDHYADSLWMVDKSIQARYFWNYVLGLSTVSEEQKNNINKKLIFGINNKS